MMQNNSSSIDVWVSQILQLTPRLRRNGERIKEIRQNLEKCLVQRQAVVKLKRLDTMCDEKIGKALHDLEKMEQSIFSLGRRKTRSQSILMEPHLVSDTSDDESLSSIAQKNKRKAPAVKDVEGGPINTFKITKTDAMNGTKFIKSSIINNNAISNATCSCNCKDSNAVVECRNCKNLTNAFSLNMSVNFEPSKKTKLIIIYDGDEKPEILPPLKTLKPKNRNIKPKVAQSAQNKTNEEARDSEISDILEQVLNDDLQSVGDLNNCVSDGYENNIVIEPIEAEGSNKRRRKNGILKTITTQQQPTGEPKRKGRKKGSKNLPKKLQNSASAVKSNLAQYVEYFSNNCNTGGGATPETSSTMSQQLVSSTTQNIDVAEQPFTYIVDSNYQLLPSNNFALNANTFSNGTTSLHNSVNYIDNSYYSNNSDSTITVNHLDNVIVRSAAPPSINNTAVLMNMETFGQRQQSHNIFTQPLINVQYSSMPVSEVHPIQNPAYLNSLYPNPPRTSNFILEQTAVDIYRPLDLSTKSRSINLCQNNTNEFYDDDEFINQVMETTQFDLQPPLTQPPANNYAENSFAATLDMPILDFDESHFDNLLVNSTSNAAIGMETQDTTSVHQNESIETLTGSDERITANNNFGTFTGEGNQVSCSANTPSQSANNFFDNVNDTTNIYPTEIALELPDRRISKCVLNSTSTEEAQSTRLFSAVEKQNVTTSSITRRKSFTSLLFNNKSSDSQIIYRSSPRRHVPAILRRRSNIIKSTTIIRSKQSTETKFNTYKENNNNVQPNECVMAKMQNQMANGEQMNKSELTQRNMGLQSHKFKICKPLEIASYDISNGSKEEDIVMSFSKESNQDCANIENIQEREQYLTLDQFYTCAEKVTPYSQYLKKYTKKIKSYENTFSTSEKIVFSVQKVDLSQEKTNSPTYIDSSNNSRNSVLDINNESQVIDLDAEEDNSLDKDNSKSTWVVGGENVLEITPNDYGKRIIDLSTENDKVANFDSVGLSSYISHCAGATNSQWQYDSDANYLSANFGCNNKFQLVSMNANEKHNFEENCVDSEKEKTLNLDVDDCQNPEICVDYFAKKTTLGEDTNTGENSTAENANVVMDIIDITDDDDVFQPLDNILEVDSKEDKDIDFSYDMEDILSLAPSSYFDSPNNDRFTDSFVTADELSTKIFDRSCTESSTPIEKKTQEFRINQNNNNSSLQQSMNKANTTEIIEKRGTTTQIPTSACVQSNTIQKPIISNAQKYKNITRTIINELVVATTSDACQQHAQYNKQLLTNANINEILIDFHVNNSTYEKLFGVTCLPYLVEQCTSETNCKLSHTFNHPDLMAKHLQSLSHKALRSAYLFMYNHKRLFQLYFVKFCQLYALRRNRTKLLNMTNDCERYPDCSSALFNVYEALGECGLSKVNAVRFMLKHSHSNSTSIIDAFVTILMDADWTMFIDYLENFSTNNPQYHFRIDVLEHMAADVLKSARPELKKVFVDCMQKMQPDDTLLLANFPNLMHCLELLATPPSTI